MKPRMPQKRRLMAASASVHLEDDVGRMPAPPHVRRCFGGHPWPCTGRHVPALSNGTLRYLSVPFGSSRQTVPYGTFRYLSVPFGTLRYLWDVSCSRRA